MTENTLVMRSMLFVPGNRESMIRKAASSASDAIILDLEDAVPIAEKQSARTLVRDSINIAKSGDLACFVRVNGAATGLLQDDLKVITQGSPDGIVLPKCESTMDIQTLEDNLRECDTSGSFEENLKVMPLIESPRGVLNAYQIATASSRIVALGFGALDFTREMGTTLSKSGNEVHYPRSHLAVVARATGIKAIDTPYLDLADSVGLISESKLARSLGYQGKMAIHPRQIEDINRVFSPSTDELEYSTRVVQAFREAELQGLGAMSLEGKMIDAASYRQAIEMLKLNETLVARRERPKNN
jgi:citrate lyase subunit beta/citryl-CoA lyase